MNNKYETGKTKSKKEETNSEGKLVIIGASAGGLEAITTLLKHLHPDTGMTFFYVQHLNPNHASSLTSLLASSTKMKVKEARNGQRILVNHVYVSTPNKDISLRDDKIRVEPRDTKSTPYLPINKFFSGVAEQYAGRVIGIILSGNATDGTEGLKTVVKFGGNAFVQDRTAKYKSMPESAASVIPTALILSPDKIAGKLKQLSIQETYKPKIAMNDDTPGYMNAMKTILEILRKETKVDFSHYKQPTLKRRLNYRMLQCGINTIADYVHLLQNKPGETLLLYNELLINVTAFFRDPAAFRYLKSTIFPKLLSTKSLNETLRIWVPACSTGEEAYSLAMIITELQDKLARKIPVRIFASDLSEPAIRAARIGEYSVEDVKNLNQQQIKRYFIKSGDQYRISKELREMCVFAHHNILSDPPFSRLDFISCCNLLIYFEHTAQKKVLATLNFALNTNGFLMLGKSESIGTTSPFFKPAHSRYKIYVRKMSAQTRKIPELLPRAAAVYDPAKKNIASTLKNGATTKLLDSAIDNLLLTLYTPACAIVNKNAEILKFRGSTSSFLSHPQGNATLNLFKMAHPEFSMELRMAFREAVDTNKRVRKENLHHKNNSSGKFTIEVVPIQAAWDEPIFLVVFTPHAEDYSVTEHSPSEPSEHTKAKIAALRQELNKTRSEMHSIIESQEIAFEELQAANEEIVSSNEEFQTLNEELETSKEEIEATNEELISTNQELEKRNDLLTESYEYSKAIIATIHEPLLILDNQLRVESANKSYYRKFNVTPEEIAGVSLFELEDKLWDLPRLRKLLKEVISKNIGFSNFEVKHKFKDLGEKIMLLNARRIVQKTHREQFVLLAIEDITERTRLHLHEKEVLKKDIRVHKVQRLELEEAVKKRTKQLERKNSELEELNKDLTLFTYISSHDLQEPLRKIRNFTSILLEEEFGKLSPDGQLYLKRTYATASRMQMLIEDLLRYSRVKTLERNFEETSLKAMLTEVMMDYDEAIRDGRLIIKSGKMGSVRVIRFQFRQLLHNLISNSVKFSRASTPVTISINSEIIRGGNLNREYKLSGQNYLLPDQNYCHIVYIDNGIGFDPQYNERIFNVFQRLHNNEEFPGSGMGLAICQRIMENHKGIILAKGRVNKGARFDICIPIHKPVNTI